MSYRPLGDEDSFPADPEAISAYGAELAATGELILEQVELLRALSRGDCWVADTADAFREQAQELADQIEQASGRYVTVGATLKTVADDLSDLERRAADRAEEAQALQRTIAANPPASPEVPPDGGPAVLTPEGEQQNARRQRALERMAALQGEFDGFARAAPTRPARPPAGSGAPSTTASRTTGGSATPRGSAPPRRCSAGVRRSRASRCSSSVPSPQRRCG